MGCIKITKKSFSLLMPPPNVTGDLHLGHALTFSIQDTIVRWKRLIGYQTDFYFGTDHAGISTEGVVKRHLDQQGISYNDLSREQFVEQVWKWVYQYDKRIRSQVKRLNISCDWERYLFTMNESYSNAVLTSFVELYKKG
ncbi:class I tRNA ligase family protein [Bacillus pacificus]|nr:class I tRNA ligase family protein [Bacillus pacificus]